MRLIYNPSFSSDAYINFKKTPVLLNTQIVNTAGLINIIKLHAGICSEVSDYGTRYVNYYSAMKKYMEENPGNVLENSFAVDKLNTAKKCLEWRDKLVAAGWTQDTAVPSERMKVISGIEKYFSNKSFYEDLVDVINCIEKNCILPQIEIETQMDWHLFNPLEVRLLESLEKRGVPITVNTPSKANNIEKVQAILSGEKNVILDKNDDSFEIWNFAEKDIAMQYLTQLENDKFDVWINGDNKEFDNWQRMEGNFVSGSTVSGITQVSELLTIGLTIFEKPLNIYNIIEWLNVPLSPLNHSFRSQLAGVITDTKGYYNEECRNFIKDNIAKYPESEKSIKQFLPDINKPSVCEEEINLEEVRTFIHNLSVWSTQKLHSNRIHDNEVSQLGIIISQCNLLTDLLSEFTEETIPYSDITNLIGLLNAKETLSLYKAEAGCKKIINSTSDFATSSKNTIWCDFYTQESFADLSYSFLTSVEKKVFEEKLTLWEETKEREYNRRQQLLPFLFTSEKLVLVTLDRIGAAKAPVCPILIQITKYFENSKSNKVEDFIIQKSLDSSCSAITNEVPVINNAMESEQEFITIKNTKYIKENWPNHQSYSSLDSLINFPVDYVVDKFVNFKSSGLASIADVSTTTGLIAHAVIEKLFCPVDGVKGSGTVPYIRKQIDDNFETVFNETILEEGAVFLIKENQTVLATFKRKLLQNLETLLKGIELNGLYVVGCEKYIGYSSHKDELTGKKVVTSHGYIGELDITGQVDMLLCDKDDNPYIFDFKWTRSAHHHADLLKENKSIQFALYSELIAKQYNKDVKAVAYFLMPVGKFVTRDELEGEVQRVRKNGDRAASDLLKEIQNTYKYRKEQICKGNLEETEDWEAENMSYTEDQEVKGLMPVNFYKDKKSSNQFSNIAVLKERK